MAWTETIASRINDEYDFDTPISPNYPKPIPKKYLQDELKRRKYVEKNRKKREKEWDKFCTKQINNGPSTAIDFDAKKLLED